VGAGLSDRLLRFVGASALLHAVFAPASYEAYRHFVVAGDLARGDPLPWWTWLLVLTYAAVPTAAGTAVGLGTRERRSWATWFTGLAAAYLEFVEDGE
jgi:hypothetical protein